MEWWARGAVAVLGCVVFLHSMLTTACEITQRECGGCGTPGLRTLADVCLGWLGMTVGAAGVLLAVVG